MKRALVNNLNLLSAWASAELFPGGAMSTFCYPLQVANDVLQMDVLKTPYPFYITYKKLFFFT